MAEYIEREALISDLRDLPEQERIEYMGIYDLVKSQTTVEVVRCRDCEHYEDIGSSHFCNEYGGYVTATDYCSRAEEKTNLKKELIND